MGIFSIHRDWGFSPSIVRIATTDNLATVSATGYLLTQLQNIQDINGGAFEWANTDYVLVYYSDAGGSWGFFSYVPSTQSLDPASGGGGGGVTEAQVQQSAFNHGTDTGTSPAYAVALNPSVVAYTDGLLVSFTSANTNTDISCTLSINGLPAQGIIINAGESAISLGDINNNFEAQLIFSSATQQFILLNPQVTIPVLRDMLTGNGYWTGVDQGVAPNVYGMNLAANTASGANQFNPLFAVLTFPNATNTGASTLTFANAGPFAILDSKGNALVEAR